VSSRKTSKSDRSDEITNRNIRPDGTPILYPFSMPPHKIKPQVPYYMCPDHGTKLGRGEWVKMIHDLSSGSTRLHFICDHLERVTVEEFADNTVIYHRAPKVRPRWARPTRFDTDRRLL
jgi:hypothetical protein